MTYPSTIRAEFLARPNRFLADVRIGGISERVHIKNTGRLRELLVPGRSVVLAVSGNPARKTKYDLIAVEMPGVGLVNIDSQAPNDAAEEWLRAGYPAAELRREVKKGASRFDFALTEDGRTTYIEVKGVTLVEDGAALFPDAPTERGVKHLRELAACAVEGYGARLLFVVQRRDAVCVKPNDRTHAAFGEALREAAAVGVEVLAVCCEVTERAMVPVREIEVIV